MKLEMDQQSSQKWKQNTISADSDSENGGVVRKNGGKPVSCLPSPFAHRLVAERVYEMSEAIASRMHTDIAQTGALRHRRESTQGGTHTTSGEIHTGIA